VVGQDKTHSRIEQIRERKRITLGYRVDASPISFVLTVPTQGSQVTQGKAPADAAQAPPETQQVAGYAVDICLDVVADLRKVLGVPDLAVTWREVSSSNRMDLVLQGEVDLECGVTSSNKERRERVGFSMPYYMASVKMMVLNLESDEDKIRRSMAQTQEAALRDARSGRTSKIPGAEKPFVPGVHNINDIKGKRVAMIANTAAIRTVQRLNRERVLGLRIQEYPSIEAASKALVNRAAEAFIADDITLLSFKQDVAQNNQVLIVGDSLAVEPMAIMMPKDDALLAAVNTSMMQSINSGRLNSLYQKWFMSPIPPKQGNLNLPPSALLKELFRMPTDVLGN